MAPRLGTFFQPRDLMFLLTEIIPKSKTFYGGLKTLVEQTSIIYDPEINTLDTHNIFNILFFSGEFSFPDAYMTAWNVLHERSIQHDEELVMWLEFTSNMLHACIKYHMDIHSFSRTWISCSHWKDYLTRGTPILVYWLLRSLAQFASIHEEIAILLFDTFPWDLSILREFPTQRSNDLSNYRESEYFQSFLHRDISSIWIYFLLSIPHPDIPHHYRKELLFSSSIKYKRYQDLLLQSWLDLISISTKYQEQSYSNEDHEVAMMLNILSKSNNEFKDSNIMDLLSWVCRSLKLLLDDPLLSTSDKLSLSLFNTKNMISVFVSNMSKHSISSPLVSFAKSLCLVNGIIFHPYSINHKNLPNQHFACIIKELNPSVYPSHREFLVHILESATDLIPWYFSSCKIPSNLAPIYYPSLLEYYISMLNILNNYPQYLVIFLNKFIIFHIITKAIATERLCMKCLVILSSLYNHIINRIDNDNHSLMDYIQERDLPTISFYMSLFDKPFVKDMNLISMIFKTLNLHCRMTSFIFPMEYVHLIPFSMILSQDDTHSIFNDIFMLLSTGKGVDWFLKVQKSDIHMTLIGMLIEHCISSDNNYTWMSRVLQYIGYHESDQETLSWCYFHRHLSYNNLLSAESIHSLFIPALELVIKDPFAIISLFNDDNACNLLLEAYLDKLKQSGYSILQPRIMYIVSLLYILSKRNDSTMMKNLVDQLSFWNNTNTPISLSKALKTDSTIEHSIRSILKDFKSIDSENIIFQSIMQNISSISESEIVHLLINIAEDNPYFGFILCQLQYCIKSDPMLIHFGIMVLYGLEMCDIWTNESSRNACFEWFINNNESKRCSSLYFYLQRGMSIWDTSQTILSYCSRLYNGSMGMIDQLLLNIIQGNEMNFEMIKTHPNFELLPLVILERLDISMIQNAIVYSRFDNDSMLSGSKIYHPGYLLCFFYEFVKRFNRIDFEIWFPKFLNSYCLAFIIRCLSYNNEVACQCLDILYSSLVISDNPNLSQFSDIKWLIYYLSTTIDNKWPHIQASIYSHIAQVLTRFSNTFLYLECIDWIMLYPRLDLSDAVSLYERLFYSINNQIDIIDSHFFRMFILESMISGIVTLQDVTMIFRTDKTIIDHLLLWDLHSPLDFCQDSQIVDIMSQERIKIGTLLHRIVRTGHSQSLNLALQWIRTKLSVNPKLSIYTWSMYLIYISILEHSFNKQQFDDLCIQKELFTKITSQMNDIITTESIKGITSNDNPAVLNEIEQRYLQFLPRWWYLWNKCYDLLIDSNQSSNELFSQHFNNLTKRMIHGSYHHFYLDTTGDELYLFIK